MTKYFEEKLNALSKGSCRSPRKKLRGSARRLCITLPE